MKRLAFLSVITALALTLTSCAYTSFKLPEGAISQQEFLSTVQTTADQAFWSFTGEYADELVVYSSTGVCKLSKTADSYKCTVTKDGVDIDCDFEEAMRLLNSDWLSLCGEYPEIVLTQEDIDGLYETVELNADNYRDYIGFDEVETENELTGYDAEYRKKYRPYHYMINTYVGPGKLMVDECSKISCSGTVDRKVTISIYDLNYRLCGTEVDKEASGNNIEFSNTYSAVYLGDTDSYCIHFTPYMDALESWYIKTFSNGLKEVHQTIVDITNINITDASGTLVIFNEPDESKWSVDPDGNKYIAILNKDGSITRTDNLDELEKR